jgi:CheY-like chemotaxis protein
MIVDVFMPTMRGFESIRLFHQRAPTVPLIAISGYAFSGAEADGSQPWGDTMPAQALQAVDAARPDRRMPVGSRAAPKTCRDAFQRRQCPSKGPVRLRPILRGPLRAELPAIMPGVAVFVSITLTGDASALLQKLVSRRSQLQLRWRCRVELAI